MADVIRTIGTGGGRDYSSPAAWAAAVAAGTGLAAGDVAIGECYNDAGFALSSTLTITGSSVALAGMVLRPAAGHYHDGTPGTGVRFAAFANLTQIIEVADPAFAFQIDGIEIDGLTYSCSRGIRLGTSSRDVDTVVSRCLIHNINGSGNANDRAGIHSGVRRSFRVSNNIVFDCSSASSNAGHHSGGIMLDSTSNLGVERFVRNNTVHNITRTGPASMGSGIVAGIYVVDLSTMNFRNNLVTTVTGPTGTKGCIHPSTFAAATHGYNATSDSTASGTGSLTGVVPGDTYLNSAAGNLLLKAGAVVIDAGVDVGTTGVGHIDILGRDRDANGDTWDIGAHEYVAAGGAPEGSGTASLSLSGAGGGVATHGGAGAAALTLGAAGEGRTVARGTGGPAGLVLAVEGAGVAVHAGGGAATLLLSTAGVGASSRAGAGSAALVLGGTGTGLAVHAAVGSAPLALDAAGVGARLSQGAGAAGVVLGGAGVGDAPVAGAAAGDGVAPVVLGAAGVGAASMAGAGTAPLSLTAVGQGQAVRQGASVAGLLLAGAGVGEAPTVPVAQGAGVAACLLGAAGVGVASLDGLPVNIPALLAAGRGALVPQRSGAAVQARAGAVVDACGSAAVPGG